LLIRLRSDQEDRLWGLDGETLNVTTSKENNVSEQDIVNASLDVFRKGT
jgi:hypothetical protein